eukprot:1668638-Pyramimonas_sp.AAC.1
MEFTGRTHGFRRKQVSLDTVLKGKWFAHSTPRLRAWRALDALLVKAALFADDLEGSAMWPSVRASILGLSMDNLGAEFQ